MKIVTLLVVVCVYLLQLCNATETCDEAGNCGCELADTGCENGGTFISSSCSCSCIENYGGVRCEILTGCIDLYESSCPMWNTEGNQYCTIYKDIMKDWCKKTCGYC